MLGVQSTLHLCCQGCSSAGVPWVPIHQCGGQIPLCRAIERNFPLLRSGWAGSANGISVSFCQPFCSTACSSPAMFWLFGLLGGSRVLWGAEGAARAPPCPLLPCHMHAPHFSRMRLPSCPRDRAAPMMDAPSRDSCIHSHTHRLPEFSLRRWGHASHFLTWGRSVVSLAALLPRGWEKAGERVQPVLLEHRVPLKASWDRADQLWVAPVPQAPPCFGRRAEPCAGLCFAVLGNFEKQRPTHPEISLRHQRPSLQDFAQCWENKEVSREETHSPLHLMGRASTSDQIIINNWFWGAPATSICGTYTLHVPVWGSSQPEKENIE